ncbi:MAG: TonB-dependent receptor [Campylobacterales bacterium]|nr:TonB-dependent receptor [Campylobacterales bacterium]
MKKSLVLSLMAIAALSASSVDLGTLSVEDSHKTEVIKDVASEDIKSADLGEALMKNSASVAIVRRSGISNDIIVRGQKKDNINVTIDGAKVCGACPNRMDPPISHILTNNVDYINIKEGPFDMSEFGALSAGVNIYTKEPKKGFGGEIDLNYGSFGYQKGALSLYGGNDFIKVLLSASKEKGEQYKDGDGNTLSKQLANIVTGTPAAGTMFQPKFADMDAYEKDTLMLKVLITPTENQAIKLSYTANRSTNILYPSSPMDADYDDSDIYNLEYTIKNLGDFSKKLTMQLYKSEVDHPMSNQYRMSANKMLMKHWLTTEMSGAKIKNSFEVADIDFTVGFDYSKRNWDGSYYMNNMPSMKQFKSINDVDTKNYGVFLQANKKMGDLELDAGIRYDSTEITHAGVESDREFDNILASLMATYNITQDTKIFAGVGKSARVPDGRELYFYNKEGVLNGNPNLDETINYEVDLGFKSKFDDGVFQAKVFYSQLENYIAYNASTPTQFENVDATIYGVELSGTYIFTDSLYVDFALAYQKGEKDNALTGQSDLDLAEIPPLKFNAAINYALNSSFTIKAEFIAASAWEDFDADNGEQYIPNYNVINLKATKSFDNGLEITLGVDNVMDKTYAVSNTYKDLTLISGGGDVMLLNEAGRYGYVNLKYKF